MPPEGCGEHAPPHEAVVGEEVEGQADEPRIRIRARVRARVGIRVRVRARVRVRVTRRGSRMRRPLLRESAAWRARRLCPPVIGGIAIIQPVRMSGLGVASAMIGPTVSKVRVTLAALPLPPPATLTRVVVTTFCSGGRYSSTSSAAQHAKKSTSRGSTWLGLGLGLGLGPRLGPGLGPALEFGLGLGVDEHVPPEQQQHSLARRALSRARLRRVSSILCLGAARLGFEPCVAYRAQGRHVVRVPLSPSGEAHLVGVGVRVRFRVGVGVKGER